VSAKGDIEEQIKLIAQIFRLLQHHLTDMHIKTSTPAIAVIGMGCWYPGARDLQQLWENILARRQQFRRAPKQRLPLSEYYDPDFTVPDKTYGNRMAVIDGFEFDWTSKRIPKTVVESADIAHWVALEVALKAFEDAGYTRQTVATERTGVLLGNTLTGEFSRSTNLRLRWPYVRRALIAAATAQGLPSQVIGFLVETMEDYYKSVFSPITEDTLSGNLSNTIAGRICNFFNFHGGGYTVDGACASSLIAVANAATSLANGDLDLALAGGVDISLDSFELIGFAKTGALTSQDMTVYDRKASGFIPGEGCGFVVLKRLADARAHGNYVYAVLHGWGISSDGKGGLTAPSSEGQATALRRAYNRAGYSPCSVDFMEGHGTGTPIGDRTELEGIALAINSYGEAGPRSCGVTSFKSLVGHTKAAAGVGALIKAVMAVNRRVLPPLAGCKEPNAVFESFARCLYPILQGKVRNQTNILTAGVSAMGFGGINCHVTLKSGDAPAAHLEPSIAERSLLVSHQETELFAFSAASVSDLLRDIAAAIAIAEGLSLAELVDLACHLTHELKPQLPIRATAIAGTPEELIERLKRLEKLLRETPPPQGEVVVSPDREIWVGNAVRQNRVGFLFPGQGSQQLNMARSLIERYSWAQELVEQAENWLHEVGVEGVREFVYLPLERAANQEQVEEWLRALARTEVAQPAICLASLIWMRYLNRLGIKPVAVGGHSLGELSAFHATGTFDEKTLLRLAAVRGQAMSVSANGKGRGAMASLACSQKTTEALLQRVSGYTVLANINSPRQMVISGEQASIEQAIELAKAEGIRIHRLPVSNGFHSQLVSVATKHLSQSELLPETLSQTVIPLFSSVDGQQLAPGLSLRQHFAHQLIAPVNFVSLVKTLAQTCDLLLEVGPGKVLSGLVSDIAGSKGPHCLPVESKPGLDRDLNVVLAALFVRGSEINWQALYENRLVHPFVPASERIFIENPLERPFQVATTSASPSLSMFEPLHSRLAEPNQVPWELLSKVPKPAPIPDAAASHYQASSIENLLVSLIAQQTGFPQESITPEIRLLDDLNLDSIKAGEVLASAAKEFGVAGKIDPASYANAAIQEVAEAIRIAMPQGNGTISKGVTPRLVRDFIVQVVPELSTPVLLGRHLEENWKAANVLILCDECNADFAEALGDEFRSQGSQAQTASFAKARFEELINSVDFTHFIAMFPCIPSGETSDNALLLGMIERLSSLATIALASHAAPEHTTVAYVQFGGGYFGTKPQIADLEQCCAVGFASSLHLERPDLKVRVLDFSPSVKPCVLAECVLSELSTQHVFLAVGYDEHLTRCVSRPQLQEPAGYRSREIAWSPDDVILVTGGAKGITAECALALAQDIGVSMALVGRSPHPDEDPEGRGSTETARTLARFSNEGLTCRYYACDIADFNSVTTMLERVRQDLGEITGAIHGAALNWPRLVAQVSTASALEEIGPKLKGVLNLRRALQDKPLKLFAAMSSVIGVTGMQRNAWYGFSNEALDLIINWLLVTVVANLAGRTGAV